MLFRSRVIAEAKRGLPGLSHIRHPRNIGSNANVLRSLELADKPYAWTLCDDDELFLDDVTDVVEAIERGEDDLISLNVRGNSLPGGWRGSGEELLNLDRASLFWHLFLPRLIYRSSRINSAVLQQGYQQCYSWYPHFPLVLTFLRQPTRVYLSKSTILGTGPNFGYSPLDGIDWRIRAFEISDATAREWTYLTRTHRGIGFLRGLAFACLVDSIHGPAGFRRRYLRLTARLARYSVSGGLHACLFLPFVLLPGLGHRWAYARYRRWAAGRLGSVQEFDLKR